MIPHASSAQALLPRLFTDQPVIALRPHRLAEHVAEYTGLFNGEVMYAVKCNDHPRVLKGLHDAGIDVFDVASIGEIRAVAEQIPNAVMHFMNPVKPRAAIVESHMRYGITSFALDCREELDKILAATDHADDLELHVRLKVCNIGSLLSLDGKFGCSIAEAADLVRVARIVARRVGLTFHVGSQCLDPGAFTRAIADCAAVVDLAGPVDIIDVGGGFPGAYDGTEPVFAEFATAIDAAMIEHGLAGTELRCEPGRGLVAGGASVLTRVELRKGRALYLNDGVYGNLAEVKYLGRPFPVELLRPAPDVSLVPFDMFGPTCDSIDSMPGPYWLPGDVATGDWLEIGQLGAYSNVFRTSFNRTSSEELAFLDDRGPEPLARPAVITKAA